MGLQETVVHWDLLGHLDQLVKDYQDPQGLQDPVDFQVEMDFGVLLGLLVCQDSQGLLDHPDLPVSQASFPKAVGTSSAQLCAHQVLLVLQECQASRDTLVTKENLVK